MNNLEELTRLHSAGAIVRHKSRFDHLTTYKNSKELSVEFLRKWVSPFYISIGGADNSWIETAKKMSPEFTQEIVLDLLGDLNWRTRLVGSYFSAVNNFSQNLDIIGTHLLKSETCCVGHIYALVLAFDNSSKACNYLFQYLDYYLTKPELRFDQYYVMNTVLYLDKINKTSHIGKFTGKWELLKKDWNRTDFKLYTDYLETNIAILQDLNQNKN